MRKVILLNPAAGSASARAEELRVALRTRPDFVLVEPGTPSETASAAVTAFRAGCDRLLVAGGDGTLHTVVNALAGDLDRVCLGVLPLGTGNDLCRTLALPLDPVEALAVLDRGRERRLDLIEAGTSAGTQLVVNVASGGFSGQLHEVLTPELKAAWGPLAYLRGAASALVDLHGYATTLRFDDGETETHELINVIVANGRYAAHGWRVASRADPEDGLLDVVLVLADDVFQLADLVAHLLAGDYLESESVVYRRARRVEVAALPGMWFSFDGELTTNEPVTFRVRPRALRILVGDEYVADPFRLV